MRLLNTVREHRVIRRLTQDDLAKSVGVSRQTVVAMEKGEYTPSTMLALKLAHSFGVKVEDLFSIGSEGD
jgi:putative transcriptional regulator